jgi:lipid-binding SYLF domain-containing protein
MLMILTPAGLRATLDSQFRIGAGASVAFVNIGGGVEGATTAALNADIVAFSRTSGLFAGISLQGSVMASDSAGNEAYYGAPVGPIDIVMTMRANNPAADPLRTVLMRSGEVATAYAPPPGMAYAAAPAPAYQPGYPASVQQQSLPPPR